MVESRGYNSLPAAAADPHTAGEGNGTGPSGGFNLSRISLALLNVSAKSELSAEPVLPSLLTGSRRGNSEEQS